MQKTSKNSRFANIIAVIVTIAGASSLTQAQGEGDVGEGVNIFGCPRGVIFTCTIKEYGAETHQWTEKKMGMFDPTDEDLQQRCKELGKGKWSGWRACIIVRQ